MTTQGYVALATDAPTAEDTTAALRALLGGLLLEFSCSGVLAFGAFGEDVRARLGASEAQLQLIASAGLVGITLSALPGAVYDRRGATATTAAGAGLLPEVRMSRHGWIALGLGTALSVVVGGGEGTALVVHGGTSSSSSCITFCSKTYWPD